MLTKLVIPESSIPDNIMAYELPKAGDTLLTWDFVVQHMATARNYWISTTSADLSPHAVPVWGIWHENRVYIEGSPKTKWARNLAKNPSILVHTPDAEKVVIIHGRLQILEDDDIDSATWDILDTSYQAKYDTKEGSPYMVVHPHKVLAWNDHIRTMTRWIFS